MKNQKIINQILIIANIIFAVAIVMLIIGVNAMRNYIMEVDLKDRRDTRLEMDLRNRGIINGELLQGEYKPYSLEQMEEFKNWVSSNKQ